MIYLMILITLQGVRMTIKKLVRTTIKKEMREYIAGLLQSHLICRFEVSLFFIF